MSRGARWTIVAFLAGFTWMVLAGWETDTPTQHLWDVGFAAFMFLLAIGLIAPTHSRWALRAVAGIVGAGYLVYFASETINLLRGERQVLRLSQPSATTAGLGFLIYGIPAVVYALGAERVGLARLFRSRGRAQAGATGDASAEPSDLDQHSNDR